MFYLFKDPDTERNNNILIDRLKTQQVVLRSQANGKVLPLLKSSNATLSVIFSEINRAPQHENQAVRLDWYDTANVINNVLMDRANPKIYKPSCMCYYTVAISSDDGYNTITWTFDVYYHLWKKLNEDTAKPEFEDIVTASQRFEYTFTAEQYKEILLLINIYERLTAEQLLKKSLWPDFKRYKMLMESGDEMLTESGDTIIGETIFTYGDTLR